MSHSHNELDELEQKVLSLVNKLPSLALDSPLEDESILNLYRASNDIITKLGKTDAESKKQLLQEMHDGLVIVSAFIKEPSDENKQKLGAHLFSRETKAKTLTKQSGFFSGFFQALKSIFKSNRVQKIGKKHDELLSAIYQAKEYIKPEVGAVFGDDLAGPPAPPPLFDIPPPPSVAPTGPRKTIPTKSTQVGSAKAVETKPDPSAMFAEIRAKGGTQGLSNQLEKDKAAVLKAEKAVSDQKEKIRGIDIEILRLDGEIDLRDGKIDRIIGWLKKANDQVGNAYLENQKRNIDEERELIKDAILKKQEELRVAYAELEKLKKPLNYAKKILDVSQAKDDASKKTATANVARVECTAAEDKLREKIVKNKTTENDVLESIIILKTLSHTVEQNALIEKAEKWLKKRDAEKAKLDIEEKTFSSIKEKYDALVQKEDADPKALQKLKQDLDLASAAFADARDAFKPVQDDCAHAVHAAKQAIAPECDTIQLLFDRLTAHHEQLKTELSVCLQNKEKIQKEIQELTRRVSMESSEKKEELLQLATEKANTQRIANEEYSKMKDRTESVSNLLQSVKKTIEDLDESMAEISEDKINLQAKISEQTNAEREARQASRHALSAEMALIEYEMEGEKLHSPESLKHKALQARWDSLYSVLYQSDDLIAEQSKKAKIATELFEKSEKVSPSMAKVSSATESKSIAEAEVDQLRLRSEEKQQALQKAIDQLARATIERDAIGLMLDRKNVPMIAMYIKDQRHYSGLNEQSQQVRQEMDDKKREFDVNKERILTLTGKRKKLLFDIEASTKRLASINEEKSRLRFSGKLLPNDTDEKAVKNDLEMQLSQNKNDIEALENENKLIEKGLADDAARVRALDSDMQQMLQSLRSTRSIKLPFESPDDVKKYESDLSELEKDFASHQEKCVKLEKALKMTEAAANTAQEKLRVASEGLATQTVELETLETTLKKLKASIKQLEEKQQGLKTTGKDKVASNMMDDAAAWALAFQQQAKKLKPRRTIEIVQEELLKQLDEGLQLNEQLEKASAEHEKYMKLLDEASENKDELEEEALLAKELVEIYEKEVKASAEKIEKLEQEIKELSPDSSLRGAAVKEKHGRTTAHTPTGVSYELGLITVDDFNSEVLKGLEQGKACLIKDKTNQMKMWGYINNTWEIRDINIDESTQKLLNWRKDSITVAPAGKIFNALRNYHIPELEKEHDQSEEATVKNVGDLLKEHMNLSREAGSPELQHAKKPKISSTRKKATAKNSQVTSSPGERSGQSNVVQSSFGERKTYAPRADQGKDKPDAGVEKSPFGAKVQYASKVGQNVANRAVTVEQGQADKVEMPAWKKKLQEQKRAKDQLTDQTANRAEPSQDSSSKAKSEHLFGILLAKPKGHPAAGQEQKVSSNLSDLEKAQQAREKRKREGVASQSVFATQPRETKKEESVLEKTLREAKEKLAKKPPSSAR